MTESRRVAIARCAMAVVLLASATLLAVREGRGQEAGRVYRIALLGIQDSSILTEPWFGAFVQADRKSTRLNSSHLVISYAVFCLKKKTKETDVERSQCTSH